MTIRAFAVTLAASAIMFSSTVAGQNAPALPEEPLGSVVPLPATYPSSWVIVSDFNFNAICPSSEHLAQLAA